MTVADGVHVFIFSEQNRAGNPVFVVDGVKLALTDSRFLFLFHIVMKCSLCLHIKEHFKIKAVKGDMELEPDFGTIWISVGDLKKF